MSSSVGSEDHIFAADGGVQNEQRSCADPFRELDELMVVVEALCPRWPARELFKSSDVYLL